MAGIKKISLLTIFAAVCFFSSAQNLDITHFMSYQSASYSDPSLMPDSKFYITIPAIGSLHVGLYNSSVKYKKLFETDAEGHPVKITPNTFVNSLSEKNNFIHFSVNEEILGFGFRINHFALGFDYRIRADIDLNYSRDLLGFIFNGNMHYLGASNAAQIDLMASAIVYNEFSANIAIKLHKLTLGARPKLLLGLLNAHTTKSSATIFTDPDDYSVMLHYDVEALGSFNMLDLNDIKSSLPSSDKSEIKDFAIDVIKNMMKNKGLGLDIGVRYDLMDNFSLAASLLDWGFIRWTVNPRKFSSSVHNGGKYYDNGGFLFQGLTMEDLEDFRTGQSTLIDSLKTYFPLDTGKTDAFTVAMQPRLVFQADYTLLKKIKFTGVAQGYYANRSFRPSFTLAADVELLKYLDLCAAYTISKKTFDNLAVGLALRFGCFNLYVATQSIIPIIDITNFSKVTLTTGFFLRFGSYKNQAMRASSE